MGGCCSTPQVVKPNPIVPSYPVVPLQPIEALPPVCVAPPPSYVVATPLTMFREFATKFGISDTFAGKLRQLGDFKVIMANDDSGSMNSDAYGGDYIKNNPYGAIPTRFDELLKMVEIVINMAGVLSKEALDLYFMNRAPKLNVKSFDEVRECFLKKPTEYDLTPTVGMLEKIIAVNQRVMVEKNVIIFLATDGSPTNIEGQEDIENLNKYVDYVMRQYPRLYITFMACVSDEALLATMDNLGKKYKRVGVVDQFNVEYKEMMAKHASKPNFTFTMGDYVTKALLVSIDPETKALFTD